MFRRVWRREKLLNPVEENGYLMVVLLDFAG